jgi:hypothetical protein
LELPIQTHDKESKSDNRVRRGRFTVVNPIKDNMQVTGAPEKLTYGVIIGTSTLLFSPHLSTIVFSEFSDAASQSVLPKDFDNRP